MFKKAGRVVALSAAALMFAAAPAAASHTGGWVGNPGSSESGGVVTLVNDGTGTSYENSHLETDVEDGDTITFEWRSDDLGCGGGVPRVFVQGGAFNTHDGNLAQCDAPADADGWRVWTATVSGVTAGDAGYTGIVNDNPEDPGTLQVRNLTIGGESVNLGHAPLDASECKHGGWKNGSFKNQGACVSSFR